MFGEGYKHVDSNECLADGYYTARIENAEIKNGIYGDYVQCSVTVDGKKLFPNLFLLNDSPKQGFGKFSLDEAMEMWNKNMTKFFSNFGIQEGNFNVASWVGHTGTITVRPQKKEPKYKEIVPYKVPLSKVEQKTEASDSFPEDIPF